MSNVCTVQPHDGHTTSRLPNPRLLRRRLFIDLRLAARAAAGPRGRREQRLGVFGYDQHRSMYILQVVRKFELQSQLSLALLARDVGPDPAGHFRLCELQVV